MEVLKYNLTGNKKINQRAHVGVVGSGDLEVIFEPHDEKASNIVVKTSVNGFKDTWYAVIERFFEENDIAARVQINDFGATPGVVKIRLSQALEVAQDA